MQIGGLLKCSLMDYPGKVAAVIFTQGCNFRCPYCHNRELVIPSCYKPPLAQEEVTSFLLQRKGLLGGVVVTGGEPTLQSDLPEFLTGLKAMGYAVKLDTNGSRPSVLKEIIGRRLVDFIAMDIKAPLDRYPELTGVEVNSQDIQDSIQLIRDSGIQYLFRTTVVKSYLSPQDIPRIQALIPHASRYLLQNFVPCDSIIDSALIEKSVYSDEEFSALQSQVR